MSTLTIIKTCSTISVSSTNQSLSFIHLVAVLQLVKMLHVWLQMETAKKTYHMACKEEKLAAGREADASVAPDQQKKLHEKTEKCKQDVQKVRKTAK